MKVGIIVHSKTGNTKSVADKIKENLEKKGSFVSIEMVIAINDDQPDSKKVELNNIPKIDNYDVLIFGAPVRGFTLSAIMTAYIMQINSLQDKKVGTYVTQHFPFKFLGGQRSVNQLKGLCESKGAKVFNIGIINWSSKKRESQIDELVNNMSKFETP